MKQQVIPTQVRQAAEELVSMYGQRVEYLGQMPDGRAAYYYHFPEDTDTGFPFVYLFANGHVDEITGFEALRIVGSFVKD